MQDKISDLIDQKIENAMKNYDGSFDCNFNKLGSCDFESLLGFGVLVDMLTIINIKLYNLLDETIKRKDDKEFMAQASKDNIKLVLERSRIKKCIDKKISALIKKIHLTGHDGLNEEVKSYE